MVTKGFSSHALTLTFGLNFLAGIHKSASSFLPLQRSEIEAVLLYLFTEPQGSRHNGSPLSLSLCVHACLSKVESQEVGPTLTVTFQRAFTHTWCTLFLENTVVPFFTDFVFIFYAQHVLQKVAKIPPKQMTNYHVCISRG